MRHTVPLAFQTPIASSVSFDAPHLEYEKRPYRPAEGRRPQQVLLGRTILTPAINLNDYRCSAVIDWLEFRLNTASEHQSLNVQKFAQSVLAAVSSGSTVFVSGPDRRPRYQGHHFLFRVQDPQPRGFFHLLEELQKRYETLSHDPRSITISGVEISVDFRVAATEAKSADEKALIRLRMSEVLRRHIRPEPVLSDHERHWPRFYAERLGKHSAQFWVDTKLRKASALESKLRSLGLDSRKATALSLDAHHQPPVDLASYIGAKESPIMLRIMDKISDRRDPDKKCSVPLEDADRRSRIEITLKGGWDESGGAGAVGLQHVGDLYGFDFKKYRKPFFEFFLPTIDLENSGRLPEPAPTSLTEPEIFQRTGVYGLDRVHRILDEIHLEEWKRRIRKTRHMPLGKKGRLVSYVELNQKVDRALKGLSRHWETPYFRTVGKARLKLKAA